jgi:hypothetical protein
MVSAKREFLRIGPETFGDLRLDIGELGSGDRNRTRETPGFPAASYVFWGVRPKAGLAGWGGRIRTPRWRNGNRKLSLVRQKLQNLFPSKLISNSKRSNFENRTGSVESRASERNGPFGE